MKLFYVWIVSDNYHIWIRPVWLPRECSVCDCASCFVQHMHFCKRDTYRALFLNATLCESSSGLSDWISCHKQSKQNGRNFHVSKYVHSVTYLSWEFFHMFCTGDFQIFRGQVLYGTVKILLKTKLCYREGRMLLWWLFHSLSFGEVSHGTHDYSGTILGLELCIF